MHIPAPSQEGEANDYDLGWSRGYKVGAASNKANASVKRRLATARKNLDECGEAIAALERALLMGGLTDHAYMARRALAVIRRIRSNE